MGYRSVRKDTVLVRKQALQSSITAIVNEKLEK